MIPFKVVLGGGGQSERGSASQKFQAELKAIGGAASSESSCSRSLSFSAFWFGFVFLKNCNVQFLEEMKQGRKGRGEKEERGRERRTEREVERSVTSDYHRPESLPPHTKCRELVWLTGNSGKFGERANTKKERKEWHVNEWPRETHWVLPSSHWKELPFQNGQRHELVPFKCP